MNKDVACIKLKEKCALALLSWEGGLGRGTGAGSSVRP